MKTPKKIVQKICKVKNFIYICSDLHTDRRVGSLNHSGHFLCSLNNRVFIPPCDVLMHSLPVKVKIKGSDGSPCCFYQATIEPQSITKRSSL